MHLALASQNTNLLPHRLSHARMGGPRKYCIQVKLCNLFHGWRPSFLITFLTNRPTIIWIFTGRLKCYLLRQVKRRRTERASNLQQPSVRSLTHRGPGHTKRSLVTTLNLVNTPEVSATSHVASLLRSCSDLSTRTHQRIPHAEGRDAHLQRGEHHHLLLGAVDLLRDERPLGLLVDLVDPHHVVLKAEIFTKTLRTLRTERRWSCKKHRTDRQHRV